MSTFDFGTAVKGDVEAFHPHQQDVLTKGNYVLKIIECDKSTSSGLFPMLKLRLENALGVQWDNLVISPNEFSVAKLLGLIEAAGLAPPNPDAGEINPKTGELSDAYAASLVGKDVGTIVRDEEDNRPEHKGEMRPRVKGYVSPSTITGAPDTTGLPAAGSGNGKAEDDDIPF